MEKVISIKELAQNREKAKGFFASRGYATVKRTYIDENGEMKYELIKIPIRPIGDHPLLREFKEKYPEPKPPVKRVLMNIQTGETADESGLTLDQIKKDPRFQWTQIFDETDPEYLKEKEEWTKKFMLVTLMLVFEVEDQFGIDKTDEFEQFLEELGFSANQLMNIMDAIKELDFLPSGTLSMK